MLIQGRHLIYSGFGMGILHEKRYLCRLFDDFCTWIFVAIVDIWETTVPLFKRSRPGPEGTDNEVIAMSLIGKCRERIDTEWLSCWKDCLHLFPHIPSQSRFIGEAATW
jgi:hypothetical protein